MRRKWKSYGRCAGTVILKEADQKERDALQRFFGKPLYETDIRFTLPAWERALKDTSFSDVDMKELLEAYFHEELEGAKESRGKAKEELEQFWNEAEQGAQKAAGTWGTIWLERMWNEKRWGYQLVMRIYKNDRQEALKSVSVVIHALIIAERSSKTTHEFRECAGTGVPFGCPENVGEIAHKFGEWAGASFGCPENVGEAVCLRHTDCNNLESFRCPENVGETAPQFKEKARAAFEGASLLRLAVCSAQAAGWPHALDYQQTEGKLFIQALCSIFQLTAESAEERMEVYYRAGLAADTLSSFTIARGLILLEAEEKEHPAYRILRERKEICHLSLEVLGGLSGADSVNKRVYVLENQMVFSQICEVCFETDSAILCTSGQCRTASLILLDMLLDSGCEIWYSGDFDPEGMLIADKLVKRGGGRIHLWHYSEEEYRQSVSKQEIKAESLQMLGRLENHRLIQIGKVMAAEKRAAYQERLLAALISDILEKSPIH